MRSTELAAFDPMERQLILSELAPDEGVRWATRPLMKASPGEWMMGVVGTVVGAIATYFVLVPWSLRGLLGQRQAAMGSVIVALVVGVWLLAALAPVLGIRRRKRTAYVVTDRRAICFEGSVFGRHRVMSYLPERLLAMMPEPRADGSGDLVFERFVEGHGSGSRTVTRGFLMVPSVAEAQRAVIDLVRYRLAKDSRAAITAR